MTNRDKDWPGGYAAGLVAARRVLHGDDSLLREAAKRDGVVLADFEDAEVPEFDLKILRRVLR